MAVRAEYLAFVLEQLETLGDVQARRMFGGIGLYCAGTFFGLIDDDTLYLKTDPTNIVDYESRGMPRFMPPARRPAAAFGYHQVPADVIEDAEALAMWARKSVVIARDPARTAARVSARASARRRRR